MIDWHLLDNVHLLSTFVGSTKRSLHHEKTR